MEGTNPSPWRLGLFGKMAITAPSGEWFGVESRKCAELLAFLALRRSGQVDRDTLTSALWPDADPLGARNRLRQVLCRLRRDIPDLPVLTHGKHGIELSQEVLDVDVHLIERRLKWLRTLTIRNRQDAAK